MLSCSYHASLIINDDYHYIIRNSSIATTPVLATNDIDCSGDIRQCCVGDYTILLTCMYNYSYHTTNRQS